MFNLLDVKEIKATSEAGVFVMDIKFDLDGDVLEGAFGYRPDDTAESTKQIAEWLIDNEGSFTVIPLVELTIEEKRAQMPALTSRQFWMAAASIDIDKDVVIAQIKAAMPDSVDRKIMIAELESGSFDRLNPTIVEVLDLMNIPAEQVDDLWVWAAEI